MDKNIFGSTSSLGGLLNEALFNEGEADQFLQELGGPVNKGFDIFSASAGSASGVASNLSGEAGDGASTVNCFGLAMSWIVATWPLPAKANSTWRNVERIVLTV